jgi:hypothetical protein
MVDKVGFDGSPTIHAPRSRHHAGRVHVFGQTRPGAIVRLYKKTEGTHHWVLVGKRTAAVDGSYSFRPRIKKDTSFKVGVDRLIGSRIKFVEVT